jgi:hypothetical protein
MVIRYSILFRKLFFVILVIDHIVINHIAALLLYTISETLATMTNKTISTMPTSLQNATAEVIKLAKCKSNDLVYLKFCLFFRNRYK